jgi:hypothetical protein
VLEHPAVTGAEPRRRKAEHLPEREVPGHPGKHGAERLEGDEAAWTVARGGLVSKESGRVLREPIARERAFLDLGARLGDGLAHLRGDQRGQRVAALPEEAADRGHQPAAVPDGRRPPSLAARQRTVERGVDVGLGVHRVGCDLLLRRGIDGAHHLYLNGHLTSSRHRW